MRLNTRGQALGRGHIDGAPLPDVGGTDYCWLTDDTPICAAGNTIVTFGHGVWSVVATHGANWLRAGKGRWFAFPQTGGDLAPADVDPYTGTAVRTRYSTGSDIILTELDGSMTVIQTGPLGTDAVAFRNARQRGGWLLYQATGVWYLMSAPAGSYTPIAGRLEFVDYAVPVAFEGRVLLLERANGRLSLRRPDSTMGWLVYEDLRSDGLVAPDAIGVGSQVRVTWSDDQSESAAAFEVRDVTLDPTTRIDLNAQVLPPVEAIPLINRVFGVCCYTFNDAESLGNLTLPIRPTETEWDQSIVLPSDRPDLAAGNAIWAVYAGENAGLMYEDAIRQARPLADAHERGLLCYKDGYPLPTSALVQPYDVAGCLLKRGASESVADFKSRCRGATGDWPSIHLVDTEVRACETFQAAAEIAAEGRWTGFSLFAVGRPGVPIEPLKARINRFVSGVTGTPDARIIPETPEDPMRIFLYDASKKPNDKGWVKYDDAEGTKPGQCLGTKVSVPGATEGGYGIRKKNGKVRALNPAGDWEERDNVGGDVSKPGQSWELFYPTRPGGLSAPRDGASYYFETVEQV